MFVPDMMLKLRIGTLMKYLIILLSFLSATATAQRLTSLQRDSFIHNLEFTEDDSAKVNSLYVLSFNFREDDPDSGIMIGKKALELATKLNWETGIAKAYLCIGANFIATTQYTEALKYFFHAININDELMNKVALAQCYNNIGICYYNLAQYPTSMEFYFRAMNIAAELKDSFNLAKCYNSIGNTYVALDSSGSAISCFKAAICIYGRVKDSFGLARSFHNLGTAYEKAKKFLMARIWYCKALEINVREGVKSEVIKNLGSLANTYQGNDLIDSALTCYFRALRLAEEYKNDISLIGINLANIVSSYIGIYEDSLNTTKILSRPTIPPITISTLDSYISRSIDIFKGIGNLDGLQQALVARSKVKKLLGDFKGAYEDQISSSEIKDSIFSGLNNLRTLQLVSKQILLDQRNREKEIESRRLINKLLIAAVVALLVGMLFLRMAFRPIPKNKVYFIKRYWSFTFLLFSGAVSLFLEPEISGWFYHNPWLMWGAYMLIPLTLEQLGHLVGKRIT